MRRKSHEPGSSTTMERAPAQHLAILARALHRFILRKRDLVTEGAMAMIKTVGSGVLGVVLAVVGGVVDAGDRAVQGTPNTRSPRGGIRSAECHGLDRHRCCHRGRLCPGCNLCLGWRASEFTHPAVERCDVVVARNPPDSLGRWGHRVLAGSPTGTKLPLHRSPDRALRLRRWRMRPSLRCAVRSIAGDT